jgi:hypothetical protein
MNLTVTSKEYRYLMSIMYATKNLISYINEDVITHNEIRDLDLKYLIKRIDRVNDHINKMENEKNNYTV